MPRPLVIFWFWLCVCICVCGGVFYSVCVCAGVEVWRSEDSHKCCSLFSTLFETVVVSARLAALHPSGNSPIFPPPHHQNTGVTDARLCLALCGFWNPTLVGMLVWPEFRFLCAHLELTRDRSFALGLRKTVMCYNQSGAASPVSGLLLTL